MKIEDLLNPETEQKLTKKVKDYLAVHGMAHLQDDEVKRVLLKKIDRQDNSARLNRMGELPRFIK